MRRIALSVSAHDFGLSHVYFYKGATWKRVFLFLSSIPITLPRPRDRLSEAFTAAKRDIMAALDGSLSPQQAQASDSHVPGGWW